MVTIAHETATHALARQLRAQGHRVEKAETPESVVLTTEDRVFKLRRGECAERAAAEREVELGRRFAPGVHLGVVDVRDDDGTVVGHAVEMVRLPAGRRLSTLVRHGLDGRREVEALAALLSQVRPHVLTDPDEVVDRLARRWRQAQLELEAFGSRAVPPAQLDAWVVEAIGWLDANHALVAGRADRAVEGHGTLRADDVWCLPVSPAILDPSEHLDLRRSDPLSDVASLAVDLQRLGRADLGALLIAAHRRQTGDDAPVALVSHLCALRALELAAEAMHRSTAIPHPADDPGGEDALAEAHWLVTRAREHLDAARH